MVINSLKMHKNATCKKHHENEMHKDDMRRDIEMIPRSDIV